ncbi:MAG TPA: hypothetical protein VK891_07320 [Euzebyales bacterium]|nr:hypothetical protein [Euzebyales bacterium]
MSGPLAVMTVLLAETAVGGAVVVWASGVHDAVRRGFLLLTGLTLALCAWAAWATARGAVAPAPTPAEGRMVTVLAVFAGLLTLWQVLVVARVRAGRVVGLAAAVVGVGALVALALARETRAVLALLELLTGAFFLGSTLFGLLLGHWYLVERRLSNRFMVRSAWLYAAGVGAAVVGAVLAAQNPTPAVAGFSPFLAVPGFSLFLAGGLVAICGLIAGFVWRLANEGGRSIQAATGMFYLAVIMAFSAELSSKIRFFG